MKRLKKKISRSRECGPKERGTAGGLEGREISKGMKRKRKEDKVEVKWRRNNVISCRTKTKRKSEEPKKKMTGNKAPDCAEIKNKIGGKVKKKER